MTKKTFVRGAAVLGAAGVMVKIIGFIFRIPLVNMIKSSSMAYYNPAYYIYIFFVTLATSGIPVAISRMVSERTTLNHYQEAHRVYKCSKRLMLGIGIVSFIIVFFGADIIAGLMDIPGAALPMRFIAPCLIIIPLLAAYRGLFQGMQNMRPTAVSQIVEQLFRVAFGLSLAALLFYTSGGFLSSFSRYERGAAGAAFGGTAGAIGGLLLIMFVYKLNKTALNRHIRKSDSCEQQDNKSIYKEILVISIPITIGASIMPFINMVDASLIVLRLKASGVTAVAAEELYGGLTGMVNSLINFPQVITLAVAMSLVPVIAAAYKRKDYKFADENIQLSMRFAMLVGMPCAVGYFVLAGPILLTLFPADAEVAVKITSAFMIDAVAVIFLSAVQTITGILQGIGKQMIPVRNMLIGVVLKIACTWFLVSIPSVGIKGAAIGTVAAYAAAAFLDCIAVIKYTKVKLNWGMIVARPLVATAGMSLVVFVVYKGIFAALGSIAISTLVSIVLGMAAYTVLIFVTKAISRKDLLKAGKGEKIIKLMDKFMK